jgi:hypothetical protein
VGTRRETRETRGERDGDEPYVEYGGVSLHLGLDEEVVARRQEDHYPKRGCVVAGLFVIVVGVGVGLTLALVG